MNSLREKIEIRACDSRIYTKSDGLLYACLEGSGTAVTFYDSATHAGGMLYYLLPSSQEAAGFSNPCQFADTGIEKTLFSLVETGAQWDSLTIKLCGAMISGGDENQDSVSRRNILAARKVLWRLGLLLQNQDVGGDKPLELFLDVTDGTVTVQSGSVKRNV